MSSAWAMPFYGPGRNYLAGRAGDAANALLAAAVYNFRRLIAWLKLLFCLVWAVLRLETPTAYRHSPL